MEEESGMNSMAQFYIGQNVEVLDEECGVWRAATITGINILPDGNHFGVHYQGWQSKHDTFLLPNYIRKTTPMEKLGKRNRKRKVHDLSAPMRCTVKHENLVEGDTINFNLESKQQEGNVLINDPFRKILEISYDFSDETKHIVIGYCDVLSCYKYQEDINPNLEDVQSSTQKVSSSKHKKSKRKPMKNKHSRHLATLENANLSHQRTTKESEEITQCVLEDELVSIGSFLPTDDDDIYHFLTSLHINNNDGIVEGRGYKLRKLGTYNLLMVGSFTEVLTNPKPVKLKINGRWAERRRATLQAAEERVNSLINISKATYEERKATLRRCIRQQIQRGLSSKKRQVRFSILYEQGIDTKLFGLNASNCFREEYSPESFGQLDFLLGNGWDYRMKTNGDRYAFATRFDVKLSIEGKCIECIVHICNISAESWKRDYRIDILNALKHANSD
ncbi:uncharacterized protein [Antedon mediterranea]|uniref:uncharacterized protein n=1 Tax=Antedon mediterranea TaxID=105859 RepID=UPI003AF9A19B